MGVCGNMQSGPLSHPGEASPTWAPMFTSLPNVAAPFRAIYPNHLIPSKQKCDFFFFWRRGLLVRITSTFPLFSFQTEKGPFPATFYPTMLPPRESTKISTSIGDYQALAFFDRELEWGEGRDIV